MDSEWVFEYMCQVLQSPTWEVPVMSFIDETCAVFDNEEENKLAHTEAHMDFKNLVENLLTQHLTEVGISSDDFYEACEVAYRRRDNSDFATRIIEQLIACDDFLTFKTIMFKRNKELEMEALMSLGDDFSEEEEEEDTDLVAVKRSSAAEGKEAEALSRRETAELQEALELSEETERLKELSLLEKEQADLEAAIAMSLAVEEERLRLLTAAKNAAKNDESKSESKSDESKSDGPNTTLLGALPKLGTVALRERREQLDENKRALETSLGRTGGSTKTMGSGGNYDEVDLARRKRHIEAQRKKLLARKQKEREHQLREYNEQKRDAPANAALDPKAAAPQRKISAEQGHLTYALARRMKQDLLENSEGDDGMVSLDAKLKQVEQLRKERASLLRSGI